MDNWSKIHCCRGTMVSAIVTTLRSRTGLLLSSVTRHTTTKGSIKLARCNFVDPYNRWSSFLSISLAKAIKCKKVSPRRGHSANLGASDTVTRKCLRPLQLWTNRGEVVQPSLFPTSSKVRGMVFCSTRIRWPSSQNVERRLGNLHLMTPLSAWPHTSDVVLPESLKHLFGYSLCYHDVAESTHTSKGFSHPELRILETGYETDLQIRYFEQQRMSSLIKLWLIKTESDWYSQRLLTSVWQTYECRSVNKC